MQAQEPEVPTAGAAPESLQQQVLDAVDGVVRAWVVDEKQTGDAQLDAALQALTQRYRLWEGQGRPPG